MRNVNQLDDVYTNCSSTVASLAVFENVIKLCLLIVLSPAAPAFTFENVMVALRGVNDWRKLGRWLLLRADPEPELQLIEQRHSCAEDCLRDAVQQWLSKDSQRSWKRLIRKLDLADMSEVADPIRSWAEPVKGMSWHISLIICVCLIMLPGLALTLIKPDAVPMRLANTQTMYHVI